MGLDIKAGIYTDELSSECSKVCKYKDTCPNDVDFEICNSDKIYVLWEIARIEKCASIAGFPDWRYPRHQNAGAKRCSWSYTPLHLLRIAALAIEGIAAPDEDGVIDKEQDTQRFKHLCNHSDCEGYYLPLDFAEPFCKEPGESCGSAVRLKSELEELKPLITETDKLNDGYKTTTLKLLESLLAVTDEAFNLGVPVIFS